MRGGLFGQREQLQKGRYFFSLSGNKNRGIFIIIEFKIYVFFKLKYSEGII